MSDPEFLPSLTAFIVQAKSATYVGNGDHSRASRPGSHDLRFSDGNWSYIDSYFGGRDFIGEEAVFLNRKPVWAMNYYGTVLLPDLITPEQAGHVIKASLSRMYKEDRFLGGFTHLEGEFCYTDTSFGDVTHFTGREVITRQGQVVYELLYHGGLVKD